MKFKGLFFAGLMIVGVSPDVRSMGNTDSEKFDHEFSIGLRKDFILTLSGCFPKTTKECEQYWMMEAAIRAESEQGLWTYDSGAVKVLIARNLNTNFNHIGPVEIRTPKAMLQLMYREARHAQGEAVREQMEAFAQWNESSKTIDFNSSVSIGKVAQIKADHDKAIDKVKKANIRVAFIEVILLEDGFATIRPSRFIKPYNGPNSENSLILDKLEKGVDYVLAVNSSD